ncbi:MAG: AraC family transcriptional regulator [Butyrivibrio sp.]|jgi:AraC family transcriptional regulator of arabinose operon|nr:AraC family transcriptional regulator [Butyrivibrio sp.]
MYEVFYGGSNKVHPEGFMMSRPKGAGHYVILLIRSGGEYNIDGSIQTVPPGSAVILDPKVSYSYSNPKGQYIDDWLHFSFEGDNIISNRKLPLNTFFSLSDIEDPATLLRQILFELSYTKDEEVQKDNINCLMNVLINHLLSAYKMQGDERYQNPYYPHFQAIRLSMLSGHLYDISMQKVADSMSMSVSYFQHLYKEFFGISYQKDVIQMRIEYAKRLVKSTDNKLEHIASLCGYTNEIHFYRQFKKITGMTPGQYRQLNN